MPDQVTFVTTDMTRWGAGKGSPVTATERDIGAWSLQERIRELEENPPAAISIANITVSGSQMTVHLSNGSTLGPFTLPLAVPRWRDDWIPGADYLANDWIRAPGGLYLVLQAHEADVEFDPNEQLSGNPVYFLFVESGVVFGTGIEESRELSIADAFKHLEIIGDSAGANVQITVPEQSSDNPFQLGMTVTFETVGANLELIAASGVTFRCPALPQSRTLSGSQVTLLYHGDDVWTVGGDLAIA